MSNYKSEISDSIDISNNLSKTVTLIHPKYALMTTIYIPEITNVDSLYINDQLNKAFKDGATGSYYSPMYGIGLDTMKVRLVKRDSTTDLKVYVNIHYMDLPVEDNLPSRIVRNDGKVVMSEILEY